MRRSVVTPAVLTLAALALPATDALAATPSSQSVTVPTTVGQTVTVSWTGTIQPGGNPTPPATRWRTTRTCSPRRPPRTPGRRTSRPPT